MDGSKVDKRLLCAGAHAVRMQTAVPGADGNGHCAQDAVLRPDSIHVNMDESGATRAWH